jgi:phospholipid transport system transporter-binding protein
MKTRKQKTPAKKRARRVPAARRAAKTRPAAIRKAKRAKAVRAAPVVESRNAAAASAEAWLALAADCTVAEADSLKAGLMRVLGDPRAVTLDVSGLQRIDTAALQLLAAFVRDRRTAGQRIEWRGRAPALDAAAGLLGLRSMLELPGEEGR